MPSGGICRFSSAARQDPARGLGVPAGRIGGGFARLARARRAKQVSCAAHRGFLSVVAPPDVRSHECGRGPRGRHRIARPAAPSCPISRKIKSSMCCGLITIASRISEGPRFRYILGSRIRVRAGCDAEHAHTQIIATPWCQKVTEELEGGACPLRPARTLHLWRHRAPGDESGTAGGAQNEHFIVLERLAARFPFETGSCRRVMRRGSRDSNKRASRLWRPSSASHCGE